MSHLLRNHVAPFSIFSKIFYTCFRNNFVVWDFMTLKELKLFFMSWRFKWVYGIAVLSFFFKQYFGNFDFNVRYCSIIQSCGFSSFWLRQSVKEDLSRYCGVNIWKTLDLTVIGRTSNDNLAFRSLYWSIRDLFTFSRGGWGWVLVYKKHARWIQH